jgi:phage tail-like protein
MAEASTDQRNRYPLPTYNFRVSIGSAMIGCSEVSGLSVGYETTTYRHGLSAWEGEELIRFNRPKFAPITIKKGMVIGMKALLDWLNGDPEPQPMEISLCDAEGLPAITWRIAKAVPVKLDAPTLSASANEAAIETLEVMVSGMRLEHDG